MTQRRLAEVLLNTLSQAGSFEESGVYPYCWICNRKGCCLDAEKQGCIEGIREWLIEQNKGKPKVVEG